MGFTDGLLYMLMVTINAFLRQKIPNLEKLLSQEF